MIAAQERYESGGERICVGESRDVRAAKDRFGKVRGRRHSEHVAALLFFLGGLPNKIRHGFLLYTGVVESLRRRGSTHDRATHALEPASAIVELVANLSW
jgi:hypothetical protein